MTAALVGEALKDRQGRFGFSILDMIPVIGRWHIGCVIERVRKTFSCIGAQLAMMEATIILETFAQKSRLRLALVQDIERQARITCARRMVSG